MIQDQDVGATKLNPAPRSCHDWTSMLSLGCGDLPTTVGRVDSQHDKRWDLTGDLTGVPISQDTWMQHMTGATTSISSPADWSPVSCTKGKGSPPVHLAHKPSICYIYLYLSICYDLLLTFCGCIVKCIETICTWQWCSHLLMQANIECRCGDAESASICNIKQSVGKIPTTVKQAL